MLVSCVPLVMVSLKWMIAIVSFNAQSFLLFQIDAGQLCASCNGIAKVDDCHRFVRCENDEVGVMNQTKKSSNYPFLSPTRYCSSD